MNSLNLYEIYLIFIIFNFNRNKKYWTLKLSFYVENIINANKITIPFYKLFLFLFK